MRQVRSMLMVPARDGGDSGAGAPGSADPKAVAKTAEQLLHAALMMQC